MTFSIKPPQSLHTKGTTSREDDFKGSHWQGRPRKERDEKFRSSYDEFRNVKGPWLLLTSKCHSVMNIAG